MLQWPVVTPIDFPKIHASTNFRISSASYRGVGGDCDSATKDEKTRKETNVTDQMDCPNGTSDLLYGMGAIAAFLGTKRSVAYHLAATKRIPTFENWRGKEGVQSCNSDDGENRRYIEAAHQREQHDDNQIGESCRGEVHRQAEASHGHKYQRNAAEEALGD